MSKVIFVYNNKATEIPCDKYETMKRICNIFAKQCKLDINNLSFKYDNKEINENSLYKQQINEKDKINNTMKIIV